MKQIFLAVLLLVSSFTLLSACKPADMRLHGYAEGETVLIAPTTGGILKTLSVQKGQSVKASDILFSLDLTQLAAQRDAAKADLARAQAQLDDLTKGERPEETEITLKQRDAAQATLTNAEKDYNRIRPLVKSGAATRAALDAARAAFDNAKAALDAIDARLKVGQLGARPDQIDAAKAAVTAAQQTLAIAEKTLADAAPVAPASGRIEDTFYRAGEFVPAGSPVVSLLPPGNIKIRFFVSQAAVPTLHMGETVIIGCDGCNGTIPAKISFISSQSEYTPPVIYSVESRNKLVFMVEALPDTPDPRLRPGLPVDIALGSR